MFTSNSPTETIELGGRYGTRARAGDVFGLIGDLGAGKTQFVKGFVAAIGCSTAVTSPTFTLLHEYIGGRLPVYHFDFYRLDDAEAVLRLGLDDYLFGDGVCLIEWADRHGALLPRNAKWLSLTISSETGRTITESVTA